MIGPIILRDLGRAWRSGGIWLPLAFLLLIAALFPFAVGPNATLLSQTGGGLLWVAALLASLLPIDRLIEPDRDSGVIDQLVLRGVGEGTILFAKGVAHWLSFGPPLLIAALPAGALLKLEPEMLRLVMVGLALGTPGLAALALLVAALTAGLRGSGALTGLLVLPLAVPILIFGAGALQFGGDSALKLVAACSLLLCVVAPVAGGAALRAGRD
ncbi:MULTISPECIES: heme exporter protein CcmB [unclassified Sphingobium]|uniref:heme exporter protein CcmB n=1 Tax=unclassified Sphingobium TaxID=2611147 RepID=UPI002225ADEA|nr:MULTISPECIES: heme exporter protein CcmB [unclassified Sphingobium]MCW2368966.1 heme exporter protein B [Sphingobium sp. B11D3D]MCW2382340.1 heme exporter protein B [Sphingobium sp. B2D3B]MCW2393956.1 heme exporter protein B [Sphingobium sp. B8D3B]MCW2397487.1 heme exporter protein B [Sphingobium sp. B2D3C]MCW2417470.1 heme exporter protein B [Sphingobium sp. B8D3C]